VKPTNTDDKPAVDQAPLQKLLAAAYVVQQHNARLQAGQPAEGGYSQVLKEIRELQEQLRTSNLGLREQIALITSRVRQMTRASGASVGLVIGEQLEYYAASGSAAKLAGGSVPRDSSLANECLRTGHPIECREAETDPSANFEQCRELGIKALVAVPIKLEGMTAGVLEVDFAETNSFDDQELRTCQLAAALVAEAILKPLSQQAENAIPNVPGENEKNGKRLDVHDTESLLAALAKIRPKLERLASNSDTASRATSGATPPMGGGYTEPAETATGICPSCGHTMDENEVFCTGCGKPHQTQRLWSSLLELQRKAEKSARENPTPEAGADSPDDALEVFPSELEEIVSKYSSEPFEKPEKRSPEVPLPDFARELVSENFSDSDQDLQGEPISRVVHERNLERDEVELKGDGSESPRIAEETERPFLIEKSGQVPPSPTEVYPPFTGFASETNLLSLPTDTETAPSETAAEVHDEPIPRMSIDAAEETLAEPDAPWNSATQTKAWLEKERDKGPWLGRMWQQHRANIYLAAASVLLVAALLSWAMPDPTPLSSVGEHSAGKTHRREAPAQPELTLWEQLLVSVGLAEPPPPEAADPGNPDTQVWVDVHTALYYCPGAELYGKTPGGKTTSQRQAQEDQFQPALRRACQ
jgi:hypothetical protein